MSKKSVIILGSTGSVGKQAMEVIQSHVDEFEVYALSSFQNAELLIEQAKIFKPNTVIIGAEQHYEQVKNALWEDDIKVYCGKEALNQIVAAQEVEIVLNAILGFAGLEPTLASIDANKRIALANKESLVVAGPLIQEKLKNSRATIIPIDSEHSAIFQCLTGEMDNPVEKILLTASGGPFKGLAPKDLEFVKPEDATTHPNWNMGSKISVDSATLINKGFEMIEAQWLFGVSAEKIEVIIHPESIIHSMVQFVDGTIKSQMSHPDMRGPIQYALLFPERKESEMNRLDFGILGRLTFEKVNPDLYPNLALAMAVLKSGGTHPCILNASNEVAVKAFLDHRIQFNEIFQVNKRVIETSSTQKINDLKDLIQSDANARKKAEEIIEALQTDLL
ncbi:MAG: 1-deoxy-D-xylulose-5-phosphate reductoisomerase [Crocinitomicaceae bacterium]